MTHEPRAYGPAGTGRRESASPSGAVRSRLETPDSGRVGEPPDPGTITRIVVFRTDRLGDLLLNVPAVRALRQRFPGARLAMVVQSHLIDVVRGNPDVDDVIPYEKHAVEGSWPAVWSFAQRLRAGRFSMAVILNPSKHANALVYLAGIPIRVGYDRKWPFLLTHRMPDDKYLGLKHEVEYNLDLVRLVGADTTDTRLFMACPPEDAQWVSRWLDDLGVADDPLVAVHPGTSTPSKRWPAERFAGVVNQLEELGIRTVLIGGPDEVPYGDALRTHLRARPIDAIGQLTLGRLAALLARSRALVSNDSGPVHVAAAVGTKVVAIFGRTRPGVSAERWRPWGPEHRVVQHDVGCVICEPDECPLNHQCLLAVTVEEVVEAALAVIRGQDAIELRAVA